jgi:hypothetical protein
MGPLAEAWRPWRGAAACALWAYYRVAKKREGAPQLIMKKSSAKAAAARNITTHKTKISGRRHGG